MDANPASSATDMFVVDTKGPGFTDVTRALTRWLSDIGARDGLLTVFVRHTSASLTIQENADPDVRADLMEVLDRIAPEDGDYRHSSEGPDDMPAHVKAMMTATTLGVPVKDGSPLLGTWQSVYLIEHRRKPHRREIALNFVGRLGA